MEEEEGEEEEEEGDERSGGRDRGMLLQTRLCVCVALACLCLVLSCLVGLGGVGKEEDYYISKGRERKYILVWCVPFSS